MKLIIDHKERYGFTKAYITLLFGIIVVLQLNITQNAIKKTPFFGILKEKP